MAQAPALRVVGNDEESGLGKPLPVLRSRIHPMPNQPRRFFDPKSLEELADDIMEKAEQRGDNGQDTPVKICRHSTMKGHWVLLGGERRWRAFGIVGE